jgi:tetratricopeptide (TPR) repeat protein
MGRSSSAGKKRFVLLGALALAIPAAIFGAPWLVAQYGLSRARTALVRDDSDAALDWLRTCRKWSPDDGEVHFFLARVWRHKSQYDEMSNELEEAARLGFPAARLERERRLAIAQTARVHDVAQYLSGMLTAPGDDGPEICAAYVNGYCLSLDFTAANRLLDAWTADYPDDPEPHLRRGDLWYALIEWQAAVEAYRACLARDPSRAKARLSLARCLIKMNEPAEAEVHFRELLKASPDNVECWLGLGMCLLSLGRSDDARAALAHAAELAPDNFEVRQRLGELELQDGRPEQALEWIRPLAEKWPDDSALATLMAQALQEMGDAAGAKKFWEAVRQGEAASSRLDGLITDVRKRPTDLALRCEIGEMLIRYRSREDGVSWLSSVLQYDPGNRAAHRALAEYFQKKGDARLADEHRRLADPPEAARGT